MSETNKSDNVELTDIELPVVPRNKTPIYIGLASMVVVLIALICLPRFHHTAQSSGVAPGSTHTTVDLNAEAEKELQLQKEKQAELARYIKASTGGKGLTAQQKQALLLQEELANEKTQNNGGVALLSKPSFTDTNLDAYSADASSATGGDASHWSADGSHPFASDTVMATRLTHPDYKVVQSEIIKATIDTAIDSDLPGLIRGVVSSPVYSYLGGRILIPAGTRLIGQYGSGVVRGQSRILVMWQRAILPAGISIALDSPGIGPIGRSGLGADNINNHFLERYNAAIVLALAGAFSANSGVNGDTQANSADMVRQTAAAAFLATSAASVAQNANIPATLQTFQGKSVSAFVGHDLDFYNVLHSDDAS